MDKKIFIFDFDGTIVDSMELFADIASDVMMRVYGLAKGDARRMYIETSGIPFFQQLQLLFPNDPRNGAAADEYEARKVGRYFDQKVSGDAPPLLRELKKAGIKTAVSSNNFQHLVDSYVQTARLSFDYVLGFRTAEFCKGAPHFQHLINAGGYAKGEMVFIGDSLKDAERARGFGIDFVGKAGLFTKEEFEKRFTGVRVIYSLTELIYTQRHK
jgi:phosphoglycolate phosphatase-like HAD superfamily hydrolase